jgi:RHS repeat-associated protein
MQVEKTCRRSRRRGSAWGFRKPCRSRFRSHPLQAQPLPGTGRTCVEGPFGEVLRATGPMAKTNPFRFSTKYQDDETDKLYYGLRYYNPSTGRWESRDPAGERECACLYQFVRNSPVLGWDYLGATVHLSPLNGQVINRSSASVTVSGDWTELTIVHGWDGSESTVIPWSEWQYWKAKNLLERMDHFKSEQEVTGTDTLFPGESTQSVWSLSRRMVDTDFITSTSKPLYSNSLCCSREKLPFKVGWHTVRIFDCFAFHKGTGIYLDY